MFVCLFGDSSFIVLLCIKIMGFADFKELESEAACKAAGKYRQQGKEYYFEDGDSTSFFLSRLRSCFFFSVAFFKFSPPAPKKK